MNISVIINQLLLLFLIIFLGYILQKASIMTESFNKQLTKLILQVTMPALILSSVLDESATLSGHTILITFAVAILMYLLLPPAAFVINFLMRTPKEQTLSLIHI